MHSQKVESETMLLSRDCACGSVRDVATAGEYLLRGVEFEEDDKAEEEEEEDDEDAVAEAAEAAAAAAAVAAPASSNCLRRDTSIEDKGT